MPTGPTKDEDEVNNQVGAEEKQEQSKSHKHYDSW